MQCKEPMCFNYAITGHDVCDYHTAQPANFTPPDYMTGMKASVAREYGGLKHDEGKQEYYAMPLEILEPLADVFAFGETKYETYNCLKPFENGNRRFYNGQMRHTKASQLDPLARNEDDGNVYHLAQVAFNALMRLYHAKKEAGL